MFLILMESKSEVHPKFMLDMKRDGHLWGVPNAAIEVVISFPPRAVLQKGDQKENDQTSDDSGEKLKRGGLIGAAAITGGILMAITRGLAAPAIASGVGA